jgi:non-ribosomal peptide synthetase component E (peptide arylation enzyme)
MAPGGPDVDLAALQAHLAASGLPKQQWPEELRVIDEFDRTPSGKIKKRTLRAMVAERPVG